MDSVGSMGSVWESPDIADTRFGADKGSNPNGVKFAQIISGPVRVKPRCGVGDA